MFGSLVVLASVNFLFLPETQVSPGLRIRVVIDPDPELKLTHDEKISIGSDPREKPYQDPTIKSDPKSKMTKIRIRNNIDHH